MQFLGILTQSEMSQIMARDEEKVFHIFNSSIQLGLIKPKGNSSEKFYLFGTLGKVGEVGPKYPQIKWKDTQKEIQSVQLHISNQVMLNSSAKAI